MTAELLPDKVNAVDIDGDVRPRDDVSGLEHESGNTDHGGEPLEPPQDEFDALIERNEAELSRSVIAQLPPKIQAEVQALNDALAAAKKYNARCSRTADGVSVVSLIGKFGAVYNLDPYFVAMLRRDIWMHNQKYENRRRGAVATQGLDWQQRAAGEGVRSSWNQD